MREVCRHVMDSGRSCSARRNPLARASRALGSFLLMSLNNHIRGCTTLMCLANASPLENVFSSLHKCHRIFGLRGWCTVFSCLRRSSGFEKKLLHGRPVDGLMSLHFCDLFWRLLRDVGSRWPSRLCFWSRDGESNLKLQPWYVHA